MRKSLFFFCFILLILSSLAIAQNSSDSSVKQANASSDATTEPATPKAESKEPLSSAAEALIGLPPYLVKDVALETAYQTLNLLTDFGSRLPNFKTPLYDVPSNVTLKTKQELDLTHPRTIQEALKDEEGIVMYDAVGNGLDATLSMRGFSEGNAVTVLVDGVRVNELDGDVVTYPLLVMDDVDSIQVDRGSTSTVYGSGAFAGVISIITGQPSPKPMHLFGGTSWSSFHGIRVYQGVSGTIEDKWSPLGGQFKYYFKGGRDASDGFRQNGSWRITDFDIKTAYEIPERFKVYANIKHIDDLISNPGELTYPQFSSRRDSTNKPADRRDYFNTIMQIGADGKFWDGKITSSVMMDERYNLLHFVTTAATFNDFGSTAINTDLVTTRSRASDFLWQVGYNDEWSWLKNHSLAGIEMRRGFQYDRQADAPGGETFPTATVRADRGSSPQDFAFFWRESIELFDRLIPYVGARYDRYQLKIEDKTTPTNDLKKRWSNMSWSSGVTLKVIKPFDLFMNYSEGFRIPTISELGPFSTPPNANLKPEQSHSYEVGGRLRLWKKGLFKANYFLIDTKDEIVFDGTSISLPDFGFGSNANVGRTRRNGIEMSLAVQPIKEVDLYGTYTWTRAETLKQVIDAFGGISVKQYAPLGQIPRSRFTLGGDYKPFIRRNDFLKGIRIGMYGTFTSSQPVTNYESTTDLLNTTSGAGHRIKPYTIWDAILSYNWKGKEVYFKVNNLFDEFYYSRAIDASSFGTNIYPSGDYTFVTPGAPREFILGMKWEF